MNLLLFSLRELWKKKGFTLLLFLVCFAAMQTVLSAVTNAASAAYQQSTFARSLGVDPRQVLHLHFRDTAESPEFAGVLREFLAYAGELPGVEAVGQFDAAGVYFSELEGAEEYAAVNGALLNGQKYENYPSISRLLSADETVLGLVEGGVSQYAAAGEGCLPLYASEVFEEVLPLGQILTDSRTGDRYELVGYIPRGARWVAEDDLVRFPMVSLDGWFIAPFSQGSRSDILTQLSSLHNTYLFLTGDAEVSRIREQIASYSRQHQFEAGASLLSEECESYQAETGGLLVRQAAIAVLVTVLAVSSVVTVFAADILLKRRKYGILAANGFTRAELAAEVVTEIAVVLSGAGLLAWTAEWAALRGMAGDLFQPVLLAAHLHWTLWAGAALVPVLAGAAALFPVWKLYRYQPGELIGGDADGTD